MHIKCEELLKKPPTLGITITLFPKVRDVCMCVCVWGLVCILMLGLMLKWTL